MVNNAISSFVFLALCLALSFFAGLCLSSHRAQHATNSCQGMVLLQVTLPRSGPERTLNSPRWGCKDPQGQEGTGVRKEWASARQPHHQPGLLLLAPIVPGTGRASLVCALVFGDVQPQTEVFSALGWGMNGSLSGSVSFSLICEPMNHFLCCHWGYKKMTL